MRTAVKTTRCGLMAALTLLAAAGCAESPERTGPGSAGGAQAAATTASPSSIPSPAAPGRCRHPAAATLPHTTGTVTVKDAGASICLKAGAVIAALLTVPPTETATRWGPITASPAGSVQRVPNTVMSLAMNATGGFFEAAAPGTVQLTSSRPGGATWTVTLVVS